MKGVSQVREAQKGKIKGGIVAAFTFSEPGPRGGARMHPFRVLPGVPLHPGAKNAL
jgi:hypothetical protein